MIEIMTFRLKSAADEATFLNADRRVQTDFAYQQPGLLRRTTARSTDGRWIVIILWQSETDADACAARRPGDPVAAQFRDLVDESTVQVQRFTTLD